MNVVDAHIHLDQYEKELRNEHLVRAKAMGLKHLVAVSMNLSSSQVTCELAAEYGQLIMPAYGFHPEQLLPKTEDLHRLIEWIRERASRNERFAIGEVGLPYYRRREYEERGEPFKLQPYVDLLEQFIILAKELDCPIVLHAVYEDASIACSLLQKHQMERAHFHWFKGDEATIQTMIRQGYYISITPDVYYEPEIQTLVKQYPLELMMVETDGPWPYEGPFQGRPTESAMVVQVVEKIASILGKSSEVVADQLFHNSKKLYRL